MLVPTLSELFNLSFVHLNLVFEQFLQFSAFTFLLKYSQFGIFHIFKSLISFLFGFFSLHAFLIKFFILFRNFLRIFPINFWISDDLFLFSYYLLFQVLDHFFILTLFHSEHFFLGRDNLHLVYSLDDKWNLPNHLSIHKNGNRCLRSWSSE